MQLNFLWTLLISLGLTEALELCFAYIFKIRNKSDLLLVITVNIITNPPVVLLSYLLNSRTEVPQLLTVSVLEAAAILTEGLYYRHYAQAIRRPFLFSLGANAFSYLTGLIINLILL